MSIDEGQEMSEKSHERVDESVRKKLVELRNEEAKHKLDMQLAKSLAEGALLQIRKLLHEELSSRGLDVNIYEILTDSCEIKKRDQRQ